MPVYRLDEQKVSFPDPTLACPDGLLVVGLYGVSIGACFFGESMFSEKENGSKTALIAFARLLEDWLFENGETQSKSILRRSAESDIMKP